MTTKTNTKILSIVGARPQFIKACALSAAFRARDRLREVIVHTGQHYDFSLSDVFFKELDLPAPDFHLGVGSAAHGAQTGRMIEKLEEVMLREKPELAVVFGDTNSTLAGALAAAKLRIPVAHVEAGMRCGDPGMPEEINRTVTDRVATLFFCPTQTAVNNLAREGIKRNVHLVGDVMLDSFLRFQPAAVKNSKILERERLRPGGFYLLTVHRAENTDSIQRLFAILEGCAGAESPVIFPVHPRTRKILGPEFSFPAPVRAIEPVSYTDMLALEAGASAVITDSGGVQKEAYLSGAPCLTLRETTEWPETVEAGWNLLVGADPAAIRKAVREFRPAGDRKSLFGPEGAAGRIATIIENYLTKK